MKKTIFISFILTLLWSCSNNKEVQLEGNGTITISSKKDIGVAPIMKSEDETENYWLTVSGPTNVAPRILGTERTITGLQLGDYTVSLINKQTYSLPAMNEPVYSASVTQAVTSGSPTLFTLACKQSNAGVRFVFDATIRNYYNALTATIGHSDDASKFLTYDYANETAVDTAFFEAGKTLKISLKDGGTTIKIGGNAYQEINVSAQELWTITLKTTLTATGGIEIIATIDKEIIGKEETFFVGDVTGEGTLSIPYSVVDAIILQSKSDVCIKGYIVGTTSHTRSNAIDNILIGQAPGSPQNECIAIALPENSGLRTKLNLQDNSTLIGKPITFRADIASNTTEFPADIKTILKNVTYYDFEGLVLDAGSLSPISPSGKRLKDAPFTMGTAIEFMWLEGTNVRNNLKSTLVNEFDRITDGWSMKMGSIWYGPAMASVEKDNFYFGKADTIMRFAKDNNLKVHGHTFLWHEANPEWLLRAVEAQKTGQNWYTKEEWIEKMNEYITTVIGHFETQFPGVITSWDVVNELIYDDGNYRTENPWFTLIGEEFIGIAFRTARTALDAHNRQDCKLFWNDYGLEYSDAKLTSICTKVKVLQDAGVPIDGIGTQTHTNINMYKSSFDNMFSALAQCGLVHLSELDVNMNYIYVPGLHHPDKKLTKTLLEKQAQLYKDIFNSYMENVPEEKQFGVTIWGVDDSHSWLTQSSLYPEFTVDHTNWPDGSLDWPLLFYEEGWWKLNAKPAYFSVIGTFANK